MATLNLDHLVKLREDESFRQAYARHDLVTADGNPIVWLSRLSGTPVYLTTGSDYLGPALHMAARVGIPVGFLGTTPAVLEAAALQFREWIPDLDLKPAISPSRNSTPRARGPRPLDAMAAAGVRLVIVALGAPRQERLAAMGRGGTRRWASWASAPPSTSSPGRRSVRRSGCSGLRSNGSGGWAAIPAGLPSAMALRHDPARPRGQVVFGRVRTVGSGRARPRLEPSAQRRPSWKAKAANRGAAASPRLVAAIPRATRSAASVPSDRLAVAITRSSAGIRWPRR